MSYDPAKTTPEKMATLIRELGFEAEVSTTSVAQSAPAGTQRLKPSLPPDAPAFFREAVEAARREHRPMVLEFHATWVSLCRQLEKETLQHPEVAKTLSGVRFVAVDTDQYAGLASAYDVTSVPCVVLVGRDGYVADVLCGFEAPERFLARLAKVL